MNIEAGTKIVRLHPSASNVVLEVIRTYTSGRRNSLKVRVKNPLTGSESSVLCSEIRIATAKEDDAGYRIDEDNTDLREQFKAWFAVQPFYQSFAHDLGDRLFDCDVIRGVVIFRNPHLHAVWLMWKTNNIEITVMAEALSSQAVQLANKDAQIASLQKKVNSHSDALKKILSDLNTGDCDCCFEHEIAAEKALRGDHEIQD